MKASDLTLEHLHDAVTLSKFFNLYQRLSSDAKKIYKKNEVFNLSEFIHDHFIEWVDMNVKGMSASMAIYSATPEGLKIINDRYRELNE